jgi:nitrogenase molybdenum-iron protein alpha/beta subunit
MSGAQRDPVTVAASKQVVEDMLKGLPKKTGSVRGKHVVVKDACEVEQKIEANERAIPGVLTNRVLRICRLERRGPRACKRHTAHHPRPIGCAYFTWGTRRNLMKKERAGTASLGTASPRMSRRPISSSALKKSWQLRYVKPTPSSSLSAYLSSAPAP